MSSRYGRKTITGTIGTTATQVLAAGLATNFLKIHNPAGVSQSNYLAATYDSGTTTPVINGAGTTFPPYGTETFAESIPAGGVTLIGNTSGCPYTIEYS